MRKALYIDAWFWSISCSKCVFVWGGGGGGGGIRVSVPLDLELCPLHDSRGIIKKLHNITSDSILGTQPYCCKSWSVDIVWYIFCVVGVLREVIDKCVAGASVVDLCEFGDRRITEETNKVYKKEKEMKKGTAVNQMAHQMPSILPPVTPISVLLFSEDRSSCDVELIINFKGIAFPTCVSIDNCVCHFSPLRSDAPTILRDGNLVKMYASCYANVYCPHHFLPSSFSLSLSLSHSLTLNLLTTQVFSC